MPITTLIASKWPSNIGYAITPLEAMFFDEACALASGDTSRVHVWYRDLSGGHPRALPREFRNVEAVDIADVSPRGLLRLQQCAERIRPQLVITFDLQPVHRAFSILRDSGAQAIVSYWGAPISGISPRWKRLLKMALLQFSRAKLDGLIFESQAMADLAVFGRGVPREMIDIVPLGVDITRYMPATSDHVYNAFDIPRDRRVLVFAGHCTPRKGIKTLVEAAIDLLTARERRDIHLLICGNTADESRPYENMYRGVNVGGRIQFAGYRDDLLQIYQSSFCGIIPSSGWDSFPRSAVEMSATGLPVIASRLQGLAEAVLDRRTGLLFNPGDASDLASCVERLLDDPSLAAALGRAGRRRCEEELNLDIQRKRFSKAVRRHLHDVVS